MATFSERFKELRQKRHYSQRELADKLGMSKSSIAMYESGQRKPDFEALEKIADFFNVDADYLLGRKDTTHQIMEINPTVDYTAQLSEDNVKILEIYNNLDDEKKDMLNRMAHYLNGD